MSPWEQPQSEVCPVLGPPLTARLASRAVEGCVLKPIRLVAWSQNEVYPVRRLTDVPLEQPQSEVYPVLGRL